MKRVSFNVAKAIKEAGYPQGQTNKSYIITTWNQYNPIGKIVCLDDFPAYGWERNYYFADIPTYIEVWLWLWREKNINMKDTRDGAIWIWVGDNPSIYLQVSRDPEEVIIAAIEYLVDNNLIK